MTYTQGISKQMKQLQEDLDKQAEESKVVPFPIITGGKGGDGNWLLNLPIHTTFLTKPKAYNGHELVQMIKADQTPQGNVMIVVNQGGNPVPAWVSSVYFSNRHDLVEILKDEPKEEAKPNAPEQSDRTDNTVRLEPSPDA